MATSAVAGFGRVGWFGAVAGGGEVVVLHLLEVGDGLRAGSHRGLSFSAAWHLGHIAVSGDRETWQRQQ